MSYVIVLEDGETYGELRGSVVLPIPDDTDDLDLYVRDHADEGEPVVPFSDILDSVRLAMIGLGIGHHVDNVLAEVEDYITNHYGD